MGSSIFHLQELLNHAQRYNKAQQPTLTISIQVKMTPVVDDFVKRTLCQKVESLGTPRQEASLDEICQQGPVTFGDPASDKRKKVQEWWYNVRRRKIRSYCRLLDHHKVPYSTWTANELTCHGREPSLDVGINSDDEFDEENGDFSSTSEDDVPSPPSPETRSPTLVEFSTKNCHCA